MTNRKKIMLAMAISVFGVTEIWRSPAQGASTLINFAWQYQDYGGTAHPLASTSVVFFDALTGLPFAGPITTDDAGQIPLLTGYFLTDSSNNLNIQPGLVASIPNVATAYADPADTLPYVFFPAGSGVYLATLNQVSNYTHISFTNAGDTAKTFEVLEFVKFMHDFYTDTTTYNATLPAIRINYSSANTGGSGMGGGVMTLAARSWGNIDTILHEYGHHVAENNNVEAETGLALDHSFDVDNITDNHGGHNYGPQKGSQLAWQEGIATYFEQVAIREGNLAGAFPGIPADATNGAYDNYQPSSADQRIVPGNFSFNASINSLELQNDPFAPPNPDTEDGTPDPGNPPRVTHGKGEGDELSVMRTLYDFENFSDVEQYARAGQTDFSNFGGKKIFTLMQNVATNKGTFYGFWKTISADVRTDASKPLVGLTAAAPDAEAMSRLGMTLEQNAISSIPLVLGVVDSETPTITWQEQNNEDSALFEVLIYSDDWTTLLAQSPKIDAGVDTWTSNVALPIGDYEYVVLNSPALSNLDDLGNIYNWYWSGDAAIETTPEPGTILAGGTGVGMLMMRRRRRAA